MLRAAAVLCLFVEAWTFSTGGGEGDDNHGNPYLQACDAISLCQPVCPPGMTAVAPPERSDVYHFQTAHSATSYVPGELVPLTLDVVSYTIRGKRDAGSTLVGNESAKVSTSASAFATMLACRHERVVGGSCSSLIVTATVRVS